MSAIRYRGGLLLVAALSAAFVLPACGDSDKSTDGTATASSGGLPSTYEIGVNMALTGAIAPYDQPALDGAKMAVDEINGAGGIGGTSKISLKIRNSRSDSAVAASVAQSLADDGVNFMLLPGDPSVAIPAGKVAQSHKIPMMSILASLPTQRQAVGPYFFVGASSDNIVAAALAKFARDKDVATAYTITGPDTAYTQNYPRYFAEAFEKMGGKLAGTDAYKSGTTDFSSQIAKIRGLNPAPDIIQTAMYEPELPAFIKQLRAAGVTIPLYTSDASDTPAVQGLGQLVDGMYFATLGFPTPGSKLEKFYTQYKAKYGHEPPNVLPAIGYESMKIIAHAVAKAGTADPQAVVDAINGITDFQGILGKTSYQGTKATEGFPVRPIAMQHWAPVTPGSSKVERVFDALVSVSPDEVPAG